MTSANACLNCGDPSDEPFCGMCMEMGCAIAPRLELRIGDNLADRLADYKTKQFGNWSCATLSLRWHELDEIIAALRAPAQEAGNCGEVVGWQARDKVRGGAWLHVPSNRGNPDFEYRPLYTRAPDTDCEMAFIEACDEAGCAYDNEALLQAIHDLKASSVPSADRVSPICLTCNRPLGEHSMDTADTCNFFIGGSK